MRRLLPAGGSFTIGLAKFVHFIRGCYCIDEGVIQIGRLLEFISGREYLWVPLLPQQELVNATRERLANDMNKYIEFKLTKDLFRMNGMK